MKKIFILAIISIICYGCGAAVAVLPDFISNKITEGERAAEAEKRAALEEEKQQQDEKRRLENQAALDEISLLMSEFGLKKGEPALFRKCLDTNGCDSYSLSIPVGFTSSDPNMLDFKYKYEPILYKDVINHDLKLVRKGEIEKLPNVSDYLVFEDMRKMQTKCNSWTINLDGVTQGGVKRCQHVTLKEIEELKNMIGEILWVSRRIKVGDKILSPAHTLKVIDISTDMYKSYSEDYYYVVKVDKKDSIKIPVRTEFLTKNPIKKEWGSKVISAIKKGEVYIGMTAEQVLLSWGEPGKVNKTITNNLVHEQWVYKRTNYSADYLYFYNNKLKTIQQF